MPPRPSNTALVLALTCLFAAHATAQSVSLPTPVINPPVAQTSVVVSLAEFLTPGVSTAAAFRAAIDACRSRRAAQLVIPTGRYVFDEDDFAFHLRVSNVSDLIIDGQGSEFVFARPIFGMYIGDNSQRVIVRNLFIDSSLPIASPGIVHRQGDGSSVVRIADQYPVNASTPVRAVVPFHIAARAWKKSPLQAYFPADARLVAPQTFASAEFSTFADGEEVLVRHYVYEGHAFYVGGGASDIAFEDVTIYSAPGMGWVVAGAERGFRFTRCRIMRKPTDPLRLISTAADGIHVSHTRGDLIIEDSDIANQGDDAITVHSLYLRIASRASARQVTLFRESNDLVRLGDELRFLRPADMTEYARAIVTSINSSSGPSYAVTLDRDLPPAAAVGDVVANLTRDSRTFIIRNNSVHDNYARGIRIQAPNGLVENNVVRDPVMNGIDITADVNYFFSGAGTDNLLVRGNVIRGASYGDRGVWAYYQEPHMGAISIVGHTATGIAASAVHQNITIENNVVEDVAGLAVLVASATNVLVRDNTLRRTNQLPFSVLRSGTNVDAPANGSIMVTRAANVTVTGNRQILSSDMFASGVHVDPRNTFNIVVNGNTLEVSPPGNLLSSVTGAIVDLAWHNNAPAANVVVEALSVSGTPLASLALAANAESFSVAAPPNTYVVRVRTVNGGIASPPSNAVTVPVPGTCSAPDAPVGLAAIVSGSTVNLSWRLGPEGSAAPTGYVLEAGFAPGLANAATITVGARGFQTAAPPGTYFVRVRAVNRCGTSASTPEIVVRVP